MVYDNTTNRTADALVFYQVCSAEIGYVCNTTNPNTPSQKICIITIRGTIDEIARDMKTNERLHKLRINPISRVPNEFKDEPGIEVLNNTMLEELISTKDRIV